MKIEIRRARIDDAAALNDIYNYNVVHERNSTFESNSKTLESRVKWIEESGDHYPILVGVSENVIEECEKLHYWKLLSRIFDFNTGSRQLCRSLGFREVGVYEKHGQLDGIWLNVVIVEKLFPSNM
ncbi:hypothetical protein NQ117_02775 [Paenibacillus sp. SC116]|uniref:GNAT family N-acetyltransferase n=1 Tax=Paenibacillus sp. SC116 TaxID=2968986 RepID=UPI00215B4D37|nr:hypothetical protein [Paenibacillus sp. SC116]MCR8842595.1 hypothetical protein [Paenibacillus sp. SC116]